MANPKEQDSKAQLVKGKENPNVTVADIQGTGTLGPKQQGDFKLVAEGSEAERNLKFATGEQLKKYQEDMRIINNLQVDNPMRFQEQHGFYPRRGSSLEIKDNMKGLSQQDRIDVTAGRKSLEVADQSKGIYRAV